MLTRRCEPEMILSMDRLITALALFLTLGTLAADPAPRGPLVDVAMREGRTYNCMLLKMVDGRIDVLMPSGERQSCDLAEVKSIKFLPAGPSPSPSPNSGAGTETAPPNPDPSSGTRLPPDNALDDPEHERGRLSVEEFIRLRHLNQRDRDGRLSEAEESELKKLRERAPMLPRLGKIKTAEEVARTEFSKGRSENYINTLRARLKNAVGDDDAKDAVLALIFAYRQKAMPPARIIEAVKADMDTITSTKVRERAKDKIPDYTEFLKSMRPLKN